MIISPWSGTRINRVIVLQTTLYPSSRCKLQTLSITLKPQLVSLHGKNMEIIGSIRRSCVGSERDHTQAKWINCMDGVDLHQRLELGRMFGMWWTMSRWLATHFRIIPKLRENAIDPTPRYAIRDTFQTIEAHSFSPWNLEVKKLINFKLILGYRQNAQTVPGRMSEYYAGWFLFHLLWFRLLHLW